MNCYSLRMITISRLVMLLLLMPISALVSAQFVGSELVVKLKGSPDRQVIERFATSRNLRLVRHSLMPSVVVVDGGKDAPRTLEKLLRDPEVLAASPHKYVHLAETIPSDPLFLNQWHLRNTGQGGGTPGADIRASFGWDITTGTSSIIIGVTDTGSYINHQDLSSRLWVNQDEIFGNGIDDDSNGFIDDVSGWNFADNSNNVQDVAAHGTSVAGMAVAAAGNGVGCAGVDWNARLLTAKCFGVGPSTESMVVDAVVYAIDNGAKVVNASWGDGDYSFLMEDMALYAQQHGVLICAASGNNSQPSENYPFYPALLPYDSILSVGGTSNVDLPVYNYGWSVAVSAPAWVVYLIKLNNTYGFGSGTSYAAPQAAGAAALIFSQFPSLPYNQVKFRLMGGSDPLPRMFERNAVGGRLNVYASVSNADSTPPDAIQDLSVEQVAYNGVVLRFTAPADNSGTCSMYQMRITSGSLTTENFDYLPSTETFVRPAAPGTIQRILVNTLDPQQTYSVAIRAIDSAGNPAPMSNVVSVSTLALNTLFYDSCDTTHPVWIANGFHLAAGPLHSGVMSWQDSPLSEYLPATSSTLTSSGFNLSTLFRPRLSFYLKQIFPSPTLFGANDREDMFRVEASSDNGAGWVVLKQFHSKTAPYKRHIIALDNLPGLEDLRIRFVLESGTNAIVSDGVYLDDISIYDESEPVPQFRDIILESHDHWTARQMAPTYSETGAWISQAAVKSAAPGTEGAAHSHSTAGSPAQATFTPFVYHPGLYEVMVTWPVGYTASNVKYTVHSSIGSQSFMVDQDAGRSNSWISLGYFPFDYGQNPSGSVTLSASEATAGTVVSDSVRFHYIGLEPGAAAASDWLHFD